MSAFELHITDDHSEDHDWFYSVSSVFLQFAALMDLEGVQFVITNTRHDVSGDKQTTLWRSTQTSSQYRSYGTRLGHEFAVEDGEFGTEYLFMHSYRWRERYHLLIARMQTPEQREAVNRVFHASAEELSAAALTHASRMEGDDSG